MTGTGEEKTKQRRGKECQYMREGYSFKDDDHHLERSDHVYHEKMESSIH